MSCMVLAILLSIAAALTAQRPASAQQFKSAVKTPAAVVDPPLAPAPATAQPIPAVEPPEPAASFYLQTVGPHWWIAPKGTTLKVVISNPISSRTAQFGDNVEGILNTNLYAGNKLIAAKGALVTGSISAVDHVRNDLKAKVSDHHWLNADGGIGFQFKTIRLINGTELAIAAEPTPLTGVSRAEQTADPLVVDKNGEITIKGATKADRSTNLAINALSFVATPVAGIALGGIAGAAKPTLALSQGDVLRTNHTRFKGFLVGAVNGIPGVGIAKSVIGHGSEVDIDTGDGITLTLKEDATYKTIK